MMIRKVITKLSARSKNRRRRKQTLTPMMKITQGLKKEATIPTD
jgi:hypothetical protein